MKKGVIKMKKLYYAYVAEDLVDYFESKLLEREVIIINRELIENTNDNKLYYYFVLKAEDGTIDPKFEIKAES